MAMQIEHFRQTAEQMQSFPIDKAQISFEFFGERTFSKASQVVTEDPRTLQPTEYRYQRRLEPPFQREFIVDSTDRVI